MLLASRPLLRFGSNLSHEFSLSSMYKWGGRKYLALHICRTGDPLADSKVLSRLFKPVADFYDKPMNFFNKQTKNRNETGSNLSLGTRLTVLWKRLGRKRCCDATPFGITTFISLHALLVILQYRFHFETMTTIIRRAGGLSAVITRNVISVNQDTLSEFATLHQSSTLSMCESRLKTSMELANLPMQSENGSPRF